MSNIPVFEEFLGTTLNHRVAIFKYVKNYTNNYYQRTSDLRT